MPPASPGRDPDIVEEVAALLPSLALALYETVPHRQARRDAQGGPLTARQVEAVMFLAHHGKATMSEFAAGLGISRAAATELVARLIDKGVARRGPDATDRRRVVISLDGPAERYAADMVAVWRDRLQAALTEYPGIDPATLVAFLRALTRNLKG